MQFLSRPRMKIEEIQLLMRNPLDEYQSSLEHFTKLRSGCYPSIRSVRRGDFTTRNQARTKKTDSIDGLDITSCCFGNSRLWETVADEKTERGRFPSKATSHELRLSFFLWKNCDRYQQSIRFIVNKDSLLWCCIKIMNLAWFCRSIPLIMAYYSRTTFASIVPILITCCFVIGVVPTSREDNQQIERNNDSLVYVPHGPLVQCNFL